MTFSVSCILLRGVSQDLAKPRLSHISLKRQKDYTANILYTPKKQMAGGIAESPASIRRKDTSPNFYILHQKMRPGIGEGGRGGTVHTERREKTA